MAMGMGPGRGIKADINVTPLVDVVLVLLIIFMVVTPLLQRGKDVELPTAKNADAAKSAQTDPLILSVTYDQRIWVEQDAYDLPNLEARLRQELRAAPTRKLLVKGDHRLSFGQVKRVMDLARQAGAKSV